MPTTRDLIGGGGLSRGGTAGLLASVRSGKRDDLAGRAAELEALQQEFGAPDIAQDKPGIFSRIIDFLSRPNYAIAGAAEELLHGRSVTAGVGRAMEEILSGIGPIQGEKRAFGEVLEGLGVGTKTLADVFPVLEDATNPILKFAGAMGSRGAAGIALDIATDPLTYMTFGAASGFRVGLKSGTRILSKTGSNRFLQLTRELGSTKKALNAIDDELIDSAGKVLKPEYLDPGGARIFGQQIPGTSGLGKRFGEKITTAANMVPGGDKALKGAAEFGNGMQAMINGLFHPFNDLAGLPKGMRSVAERLHRKFEHTSAAHRTRLIGELEEVNKTYRKMVKADPELGKKLYRWREGDKTVVLTDAERAMGERISKMYDQMYDTAHRAGILDDDQMRLNYFAHYYENPPEDFLQVWAALKGRNMGESLLPKHTKERIFDRLTDAEEVSTLLNKITTKMRAAGRDVPIYPILKPDYDLMRNTQKYINAHADMLARKAWYEDAAEIFGKNVEGFDFDALYDLTKVAPEGIESLGGGIGKAFEEGRIASAMGKTAGESIDNVRKLMPKLSDEGKREAMRQLFVSMRSGSEWATVMRSMEKWEKYFPAQKTIKNGDIERSLAHYGEEAAYGIRTGAFWGDEPIFMPEIIAKDIENVNSKLINSKDYKAFHKMLRQFDRINNWFKLGVYTFWPASLVRDAYSNVALSMLDVGVGALDPKLHRASIAILAKGEGELITKAGVRYGYKELRKMSRDFGVYVPGEVFVEATGEGVGIGRTLKKAARKRGLIENEARIQLWLNNVRRGMDPKDAADKVGEFLFNYGELSTIEREVFRRFIPFYTFTRKNIQLQAKALRTKPGLVAAQVKPFRQRESESESMIKWEAESLGMRLDRDGKTVHVINGIDLPLRNLDTLWSGTKLGTARRMMGMITPVLKVPMEVVAQRDFFTGGDLKRTRGDTMGRTIEAMGTPQPVKDWLGYKKVYDDAGRPRYTFDGTRYALLVRSWAFSRVFSTSDRQFREYLGDRNVSGALLDFMTGLRSKDIDLDEQGRRKLHRRIRQLEESLVRRGVLPEFSIRGKKPVEGEF